MQWHNFSWLVMIRFCCRTVWSENFLRSCVAIEKSTVSDHYKMHFLSLTLSGIQNLKKWRNNTHEKVARDGRKILKSIINKTKDVVHKIFEFLNLHGYPLNVNWKLGHWVNISLLKDLRQYYFKQLLKEINIQTKTKTISIRHWWSKANNKTHTSVTEGSVEACLPQAILAASFALRSSSWSYVMKNTGTLPWKD